MKFTLFISVLATSALTALATPAEDASFTNLEARGDSGCYAYENPDCGIDTAYCVCANDWYYLYNQSEDGCNPPWGIVAKDESELPGWTCG
ncbi:hypothetical protein BO94DRAFT_538164 [Aspergillus sclerotioniger CBS 115572]|uniref:Chitin-binding type-2 domain-containing protein n=1 Tax=Aspergillus sclerotioniger CBS 115572 TaxID=1450535 RepID=A0A317VWD5_9EURO|nr:hypothetical protein BO94DRAFT_538164 [Aspergillus sclerotioniger CBS 115572]PWY77302.1 hypothetical protein BO94DRAFT_538164 [Aspergillus sclerotioniger CBS 115572]